MPDELLPGNAYSEITTRTSRQEHRREEFEHCEYA
jgi:hypothetical protein